MLLQVDGLMGAGAVCVGGRVRALAGRPDALPFLLVTALHAHQHTHTKDLERIKVLKDNPDETFQLDG